MAVYYVYSGAAGSGNGSSWANAFTTLTLAFATEAAGDTLYVAHDHAESSATSLTLTSSGTVALPTKLTCVDRAGSVPPVSADRRATAQVTTTGGTSITFQGFAHYDGIIFSAGTTATACLLRIFSTTTFGTWLRFDNCSLRIGSTASTNRLYIGGVASAYGNYVEMNNTTLSFANATQGIIIGAIMRWRNTPSALLGTIPATLWQPTGGYGGEIECIGVDFSAAGSGKTIVGSLADSLPGRYRFIDCKLNASVTKSAVPLSHGSTEIDYIRSGSSGVNYAVHRHRMSGLLIEETTVVRTGGATDGTTPLSWRIDTTANCNYSMPFECPVIAIWNDTTGSAVVATVEGIWGGGATPLDTECWVECEFLSDASSPMGGFAADCAADLLTAGTNQTSSSETWGGSTTKFKLNVTFTAQQKGWVYARVKCAKASSTFYVDPLITLT